MRNEVEVEIIGGIGNQLFSYVCGYCMAKENDALLYLDLDSFQNYFRAYKLDRLNIAYDGIKRHLFPHRIRTIYRKYCLKDNFVKEKWNFVFQNVFEPKRNGKVYLQGYWQSEKYCIYENDIRNMFCLKKEDDIYKLNQFKKKIENMNTVAVHIRRGDYVTGKCAIDMGYYDMALEYMKENLENPIFIFFSDDISYVIDRFNIIDTEEYKVIQDFSDINEDIVELFMMSYCNHHIIANSTFSWWAAWLNQNKEQIVLAPNVGYLAGKDFYPDNWKRIEAKIDVE